MRNKKENEVVKKISEGLLKSTKKMLETKRKLGQKIVISEGGIIKTINP